MSLIAVGACLFTGVGLLPAFKTGVDPTRIAAQIVTGVGFLGAGAILRLGNNVHGLTTAAMIWLAAAVGMAVGFGYFLDRKSTRLNSSHQIISYAVFCLKKKKKQ